MTITKTIFKVTLLLIFINSLAQAEILRWPQLCSSGKLQVVNYNSEVTHAWIQRFTQDRRMETEITLQPYSKTDFTILSHSADDRFTLMHFSTTGKISATFYCEKSNLTSKAQSLEGGVMTFNKSDLPENKIWLQNLYSADNQVKIEFLNSFKKTVFEETLTLGSFEQRNYKNLNNNIYWSTIRVSADNRFTAFLLTSKGSESPQAIEPQKSELVESGVYFLVAPRTGAGDSFVVRIKDAQLIARARELIAQPQLEKMIFAQIEKGHGGFNRNWSKKEKSFWSWSTSEVTNFADLGSTSCNGMPQLVEDEVDQWVLNPGRICFWNYRIKKELSAEEVSNPH